MATLSDKPRKFLEEGKKFGVVATLNSDDMPHQTVVWYELQGDRIMMNTRVGRKKEKNLKRDPRISFCIEEGYHYLTVEGRAVLDYDAEHGRRDITKLAIRYHGEEKGAEMARDRYSKEERVTIYLTPDRVDDSYL